MNTTLVATFFSFLLILLFAGLARRFDMIKNIYYMGVAAWSEWLPVFATASYMAILASNLISDSAILNLSHYFTGFEITAMFFAGVFFFMPMGNVVASFVLCFGAVRIILAGTYGDPSISLYLLAGSATLVAILGDRMPWHADKDSPLAHQLREVILVACSLLALCLTILAMKDASQLSQWVSHTFGMELGREALIILLTIMAVGWLTVTLGLTRHFMLPLLSLPTIFVLAFLTAWPAHILVIPFAICLALSLSVGERRQLRQSGRSYTSSLLISH